MRSALIMIRTYDFKTILRELNSFNIKSDENDIGIDTFTVCNKVNEYFIIVYWPYRYSRFAQIL